MHHGSKRDFKSAVCASFPSVPSRENSLGRKLALEPDRLVGRSLFNFTDCVELFGASEETHLKGSEPRVPTATCGCDSRRMIKLGVLVSFSFLADCLSEVKASVHLVAGHVGSGWREILFHLVWLLGNAGGNQNSDSVAMCTVHKDSTILLSVYHYISNHITIPKCVKVPLCTSNLHDVTYRIYSIKK